MSNYIVRLETELARQTLAIEGLHNELAELRGYLLSDKFHNDTTVQVRDVLHRLDQNVYPYFYVTQTRLSDLVVEKYKKAAS